MAQADFFFQAFVYLGAAVLSVPIAKRLGLGSVLGYLIAGVLIGPFVLGLIGEEGQSVMHFAEFGVVMMLFLVGLELEPSLLWRLRTPILGLGGLQVLVTSLVFGAAGLALGLAWQAALAVGMIASLSSTAIVLQTLSEKGQLKTAAGQSSFAVLLFQDIAVIPMLALFPLLATHEVAQVGEQHGPTSWVEGLPGWSQTLIVLGAVAAIVAGGHYLIRPAFRAIAATRLRELFVAAALLLVIGIALLMTRVGLSPALGTFVAGVVLANSEYKHELESDIDPFKGLLLGLFFIAVGASIDFRLVADAPATVFGLVAALMLGKLVILVVLARVFALGVDQSLVFGFGLAQASEFGFVLLSFAIQSGVLAPEIAAPLVVVVALSMALTPLLMVVFERVVRPRVGTREKPREFDDVHGGNPVIIAGFGRFGQICSRLLAIEGIGATVLEADSEQVEALRKFGRKVFYGDASRYDLLHAAGADSAKLLILALDKPDKVLEIVHTARKHWPHLQIIARSYDRIDAYDLLAAGVDHVYRETFDAALRAGTDAMVLLGQRAHKAHRAAQRFRRHDERLMRELAGRHRDEEFIAIARERYAEVETLLRQDQLDVDHPGIEPGWDSTPLVSQYGGDDDKAHE